MNIGVIGLGQMGGAISKNLLKTGFHVSGYDILPKMLDNLAENGGDPLGSVQAIANACDLIILSIPSTDSLFDVTSKIIKSGRSGLIVLELSTLKVEDKHKAYDQLSAANITLMDIPMSGTGVQAKSGDLVYFASGERLAFNTAKPVLEAFCKDGYYLGCFGNGSRMKFVANLLVAIHNVAAGEALTLAQKSGLNPEQVLKVIGASAATSKMLEVRGAAMLSGAYGDGGIALNLFQKDISIIREFAKDLGVITPLFETSSKIYDQAMNEGHAEDDTACVCAVLERMAGIGR